MQEIQVQSLCQEDPLEKEWQPIPVLLPGEFHGQRNLAGYSPRVTKESDLVTKTRTAWYYTHSCPSSRPSTDSLLSPRSFPRTAHTTFTPSIESACNVGNGFSSWIGKIPWRRKQLPTSVFYPGEFHGQYSPWGRKGLGATERFSRHFTSSSHSSIKPYLILWSESMGPLLLH